MKQTTRALSIKLIVFYWQKLIFADKEALETQLWGDCGIFEIFLKSKFFLFFCSVMVLSKRNGKILLKIKFQIFS
jgi:hypothetical protein